MTININALALKAVLNNANPNVVPSMLQGMNFGDFVRAMPVPINGLLPLAAAVDPYVVAAAQSYSMPDDAKGMQILLAYARAGTGTVGPLTVDASGDSDAVNTAPAAGHVAISANGDILFNAADAWTAVDLYVIPWKLVIIEQTLTVSSNTLTFPTASGFVQLLLEAQATAGTVTGTKIVDKPGTAVAAGHAALNSGKTGVAFQATDAVTQARVKYGVYPTVDINALLEQASNLIS